MFIIRKATLQDLDQIKNLADSETETLGFIRRAAIIEGIELGYVFVAESNGKLIGFQQYYHRKRDLKTILYRKTVIREWRRKGVGKQLVDSVMDEAIKLGRESILLKCPIDNESNFFHQSYGFVLIGVEPGKRRKLNVYEFRITDKR